MIAKYKVVYPESFSANYVQVLFNDFIKEKTTQKSFDGADYILTDSPHVRMMLNVDPWNYERVENMYQIPKAALKEDPIIIWDKYFSVLEAGVSFERLEKEGFVPRKKLIDAWHQDTVYIIYTKANSAHAFE